MPVLDISQITSTYYLRVKAKDKAGVLSDITEILGEQGISIEAVIQKEPKAHDESQSLSVVILTDEVKEEKLQQAVAGIEAMEDVSETVIRIRVEKQD